MSRVDRAIGPVTAVLGGVALVGAAFVAAVFMGGNAAVKDVAGS